MSSPVLEENQLGRVLRETSALAELFSFRQKRLYLVGGAVRNLVLRGPSFSGTLVSSTGAAGGADSEDDYDFTTDALPAEVKQIVKPVAQHMWTQGERFGTIGCRIARRNYEITTHRKEAYDPVSRKPAVVFGEDIGIDLSRRDFTINAMALKLPEGSLIDPFDGVEALRQRLLKTPLSAEESFRDDPLRMLRAARFVAQFDLTASNEVVAAMSDMRQRLEIVSVERICAELMRLLMLAAPATGFKLLAATGLDEFVFAAGGKPDQDVGTDGETGSQKVLSGGEADRLNLLAPNLAVRLSALLFGCRELKGLLWQLRLPSQQRRKTLAIVEASRQLLSVLQSAGVPERPSKAEKVPFEQAIRRWMLQLDKVARKNGNLDAETLLADIFAVVAIIAEEQKLSDEFKIFKELHAQQPPMILPVTGADVMHLLDMSPGPKVKEALGYLTEQLVLRGKLSQAEALEQLKGWWDSQAHPLK